MGIRNYNPTSAGRRTGSVSDFADCTTPKVNAPFKPLLVRARKTGGRNNQGIVTSRFRGGGHKQMMRVVDFKRKTDGVEADSEASEEPTTLEALIARQASTLDGFAKDVTAAIRDLQQTVGEMRGQIGRDGAHTSHPRVGLFVDVPNVIYAAERRGITLDFGRVLDYFTRDRELVRASAYAPITDDPQAKLESQRFAHHFIGHPYRLVTKPLKRFADGSMKANFDIELAVDILTMSERLDVVVLMSGDGDFVRVVELVASRGVRVEICAFAEAASQELKTVGDVFIDIGLHLDDFKTKK